MTIRGVYATDNSMRVISNSDALTVDQVTVTNTATLLIAANAARRGLVITNTGDQTVYLGGSGVLTTTGYPLGQGLSIYLLPAVTTAALYGVVAADSEVVGVMEF